MYYWNQFRVGGAIFCFLSVCLLTIGLTLLLLLPYLLISPIRPCLQYSVCFFWAKSIHVLSSQVCMGLFVKYTGVPVESIKERPLILTGLHQGNLLHGTVGGTLLRLSGESVSIIAKHDVMFLIRLPLKLFNIGVLIDRKNREEALERIKTHLEANPTRPFIVYPCGTRWTPEKSQARQETLGITQSILVMPPRTGALWAKIEAYRDLDPDVVPHVLFVPHRTAGPDWKWGDFHKLVNTQVDIHVEDITDQVAVCDTQAKLTVLYNKLYEAAGEWRSKTMEGP
jgi:1-acyl-sn-glycerol-3-phosphate acyltransferase